MADLPIVMNENGPVPTPPATIWTTLLANVAASNPGYTANLPGSLIEDISSTDVAAVVLCDTALVELINSVTPYGANAFLLQQLGNIYGVQIGQATNTSVEVQFTGTPGFVVAQGFVVTDGTYQYVLTDGGIIGSGGVSPYLSAVANVTGSWAVPAGTVTGLVTSVPSTITLSVTNPLPGTPSVAAESETSYRTRVLQAGLASSQGMASYLKTLLGNVKGVQPRLISVQQLSGTQQWKVLVGGGSDNYQVAYAIYSALFDVSSLVGSTLDVIGITNANPGVVTTNLNHGYATGQVIQMNGVGGMTAVNGVNYTITVISETTFSIGVNTTGYGTYTTGGVVTPNLRNVSVSIIDYPDTYVIPFVNPPLQTVTMTVLWNTISNNYVNPAAIAQLGAPALASYVNSISVGQPMNLFELQTVLQVAVSSVLPAQLLTRIVFEVSINGIGVTPESGTGIIAGDPESYFYTDPTGSEITILQG